jgi:hypothetical protein
LEVWVNQRKLAEDGLRVFVEQAWDVLEPEVLAPQALLPHGGNAEGSTLRLSSGCILAEQLGIQLRRVGSGKRLTFGTGEQRLS